jgi:hypothetical protein
MPLEMRSEIRYEIDEGYDVFLTVGKNLGGSKATDNGDIGTCDIVDDTRPDQTEKVVKGFDIGRMLEITNKDQTISVFLTRRDGLEIGSIHPRPHQARSRNHQFGFEIFLVHGGKRDYGLNFSTYPFLIDLSKPPSEKS